ncbi:MAG: Fic family protein [archaeon]
MGFVELKERNGHKLYYYAKSMRVGKKVKKKRIFLGTDLSEELIKRNSKNALIELGELDFDNILNQKELSEFELIKTTLNLLISQMEKKSFYEHFVTEFTYSSNAIEGSTLTLKETSKLLFEGQSPKKPMKNILEAQNHKTAYDYLTGIKGEKIGQDLVCQIQELVVKGTFSEEVQEYEGKLRSVNVRVGVHIAPQFVEVPKRLTALIRWFNSNRGKVHPIVFASYFHSEFENIHPFVDGNGRTGRLFLNFMLTKAGYPPIVIFFKHRPKYYEALEKACEKKDLKPLIKILKKCYEEMIKIYGGETKY